MTKSVTITIWEFAGILLRCQYGRLAVFLTKRDPGLLSPKDGPFKITYLDY